SDGGRVGALCTCVSGMDLVLLVRYDGKSKPEPGPFPRERDEVMKALLALVVIPFAVVACGGSPSDEGSTGTATSAQSTTSNVSGHWVNSTPCNTTFFSPGNGHLKCDGFTNWTGVFNGSSHYFFDGYVDHNNNLSGSLSETFTGNGLGTSGTFHM